MLFRVADTSLYAGSLSVREVGGLLAVKCQSVKCQSKTDQLTQSAKMALVIPDKFQHILRVMNTNIHDRKNYCPGFNTSFSSSWC